MYCRPGYFSVSSYVLNQSLSTLIYLLLELQLGDYPECAMDELLLALKKGPEYHSHIWTSSRSWWEFVRLKRLFDNPDIFACGPTAAVLSTMHHGRVIVSIK
jgi:hypothetical protein